MAKGPAYFLTLFKVEGHTKWRAHFAGSDGAFDEQVVKTSKVAVTEKKVLRIDRTTAEIDIKD